MTLAEMVSREQEKAVRVAEQAKHWHPRRDKWLQELDSLFRHLTAWLQQAGVESEAIEQTLQRLYEEPLGHYETPVLTVTIGLTRVRFQPKGTFLIGAFGRVDVSSDQPDTPTIKLVADAAPPWGGFTAAPPEEQPWQWLVYPGGTGPGGYALTQETFVRLMALVLGKQSTDGR